MNGEKQIDFKEYARQMRENCIKDRNGNIVCSGEMWEEIATIIERLAVYLDQIDGRWYVERVLNRYASRIGRNVFIKVFCCSVCGKSNGIHRKKYCPNCGAKMKGV